MRAWREDMDRYVRAVALRLVACGVRETTQGEVPERSKARRRVKIEGDTLEMLERETERDKKAKRITKSRRETAVRGV